MKKVYISGALTESDEPEKLERFYEDMRRVCKDVGMVASLPHHRGVVPITDEEFFERNKAEIRDSDLLIAYVGVPSTDVGSEIKSAELARVPIILLYERDKSVSRLVRGSPAVVEQGCFETFEEALGTLKKFLAQLGFCASRTAPWYDPSVDRGRMPGRVPRNV